MNNETLLYGKSNWKRIVGLEVGTEGTAEIFTQAEDNSGVISTFVPARYWLLANENLNGKFARLNGDLHYKWGIQYNDYEQFGKMTGVWRNEDTFKIWNKEEALMVKDGYTFFRDMRLNELAILSFDIETTGLDGYAIDAKVLLISTSFRNHTGVIENKLFSHDEYESEGEMLVAFCEYVKEKDPSVVLGHNIFTYDFPYLQARAEICGVSLELGRDGSPIRFDSRESKFRLDGSRDLFYKKAHIYGREITDTYFLSVSFDVSKSFESYGLKPLIKQLGYEKEGRQYYDAGSIRDNYKDPIEWKKIKAYAEADAEDPIKLFDMMAPLYFNMCPMIPKPFTEILLSASGSKINGLMLRAYLQDKHSLPKASEVHKFKGAISFGIAGIYKNAFKIDLSSLYPSIIINYSVYDSDKDPKGYLLSLVKTFRSNRLELKKKAAETGDSYWQQMDTTTKGLLNSFYGFLSAQGLAFNSPECAEFITAKGREILAYTIKWASGKDVSEFVQEGVEEEDESA